MIAYQGLLDDRPTLTGAPTRFRLFGFDEDIAQRFRTDLADLEVVDEPMTPTRIEGAVLKPLRPRSVNGFSGGVFGADRQVVPQSLIRRQSEGVIFGFEDERYPESPPTVRIEQAFWGGMLFHCYGHVILESIARLSPEVIASDLPILFHVNAERPGSVAVFKSILAFLGIDENRLHFVDEVTQVGVLLMPPPGIVIGERLNLAFVRNLRRIVGERIDLSGGVSERPLLLSRSALKAQMRKPFGEEYLEAHLAPLVDIVHPQEHGFAEQVALANASSRYVGFLGSQMHNLLFNARAEPIQALYWTVRRVPRAYLQIDLALGGVRNYVHVAKYGSAFEYGRWTPFMLDFHRAEQGLRGGGYVPATYQVAPSPEEADAMLVDYYRDWADGLFRFRFARPSQYWAAGDVDREIERTIAAFRPRLTPLLDDPELRPVIRDAALACFSRPRHIDPAVGHAFMQGLFEPGDQRL